MREKTLFTAALLSAVIGVGGITVAYMNSPTPATLPGEIRCTDRYSDVQITGTVRDVRRLSNITIFELEQRTPAVIYQPTGVREGMHVVVWGSVDTYDGEKQVVVSKVRPKK